MGEKSGRMNILLVGQYFAPVQAIASVRWTKIAKYLKRAHDVQITVLTNYKQYDAQNNPYLLEVDRIDELLKKDETAFDQYIEAPLGRWARGYYSVRKALKRLLHAGEPGPGQADTLSVTCFPKVSWKQKAKLWFFDQREYCWAHDVFSFAKKNLKFEKYDVVISSFGPAWPHLVAEKIKKANPGIIWLADFRDPYATSFDDSCTQWRHKRFMMKHCIATDKILRVSDIISTDTPPQIPVYMISNGYDPEETLSPLSPKHFDLVFTGFLYGGRRDIGIACEVLKQLCSEGKMQNEDVSVIYAGLEDAVAKELAKRHHAKEFLHTTGLLPRIKAQELQQTAAVLLQANWNTEIEKCFWSGKMYEYMAVKKPIVYLVSGNVPFSEASKYIHLLDGCCYEQCRHKETYPVMKKYILEKYKEWKETGNVTVHQDQKYVEQYSYSNIAEQVWGLIQKEKRESQ